MAHAATVAAVACSDPSVIFCYLTALRIWRLPHPRVPEHIHVITQSPHKAGRLPSTTRAARNPKTGLTGLEHARGYGVSRHHWAADIVERQGVNVTSLVQTVIDCIVRLELPDAVAIVDTVLGGRRDKGEGLTRLELQEHRPFYRRLPRTAGSWR
jgi:hypothetical protein